METRNELVWEERLSVGVMIIDEQHKMLFKIINELVGVVGSIDSEERIQPIVNQILQYKKYHFATEERYFKEFKYEKAEDHIKQHHRFSDHVDKILEDHKDDMIKLAFVLVDYLEDWLIGHLMTADQQYKECFHKHGLH